MSKYVHGYSEREAERLKDQSSILEKLLHGGTRYPAGSRVLEAGCGVGAQTEILAGNSPHAQFTSVDISAESLEKAKARIAAKGIANVEFKPADVFALPFEKNCFDHVFVCFLLEHLDRPLDALAELKRVLKPGGTITVIEGDHGSCFWHPETAESKLVWGCLIRVQKQLGHDPLIGRRVYPLLRSAGFNVRHCDPKWVYGDALNPALLDGMVNRIIVPMVETAREKSLELKLADEATWKKGIADLEKSGVPPGGTFFYTWFKALGVK